jgi:hypothetical protein
MKVHELKIWPEYWAAVRAGDKTFEYRLNDRNYKSGDLVRLTYFDPKTKEMRTEYPWSPLCFEIGYILTVIDQMIVFSLLELNKKQKHELSLYDFNNKMAQYREGIDPE